MPSILIAETCQRCLKQRSLHDLVNNEGAKVCRQCRIDHLEAIQMMNLGSEPHCQECLKTVEQIEAENPSGNITFELHTKDGIYQLLCTPCGIAYAKKQRLMFAGTEWGKRIENA